MRIAEVAAVVAGVASVFPAEDVDRVDLEEWIRSALSASLSIGSSIKASSFSVIAGSEQQTCFFSPKTIATE